MKKIVLFIILFITILSHVSAEEKTLIKEKINNYTTYYYDKDLSKYRYLYAQKFYFGDNLCYCVELGKDIINLQYTYTDSFEGLKIDNKTLNEVKLIAYYGYEYPGHNTDKYYMATQELIWKKISNISISWIEGVTASQQISVENEKNEILELISNHYKKPSFDNTVVEYTLGTKVVLEDTNYVLNGFTSDNKNVIIEDNKLILTEDFNKENIVLKKINYNDKIFLLYSDAAGVSQKMMSTGAVDDVKSTINVNITKGSIELNKLDKDTLSTKPSGEATLEGATYELYNNNNELVGTFITGKKNKIENLSLGHYTLKETIPSTGYLLDEKTYNIEITKDNLNVKKEVYEEVIKRNVEIYKVFASDKTGELTGEPNITFEIYNNKNILVNKITTDSNGYTNVTLPYGTYTFKQINTTKNYYKLDDFKVTITHHDEKPIHKLLSNSEIKAKVRIIKKDYNTKNNIINSNIKFKIFDVKNNKYLSLNVSYPENKLTEEFQVDRNGIFITPIALSPGQYILEEIKSSMNNYIYNNEKIKFEIGENSNFIEENNELLLEVIFYNKIVKGKININKYGEEIEYHNNNYKYKEIPLKEVTFNLYAKEDIYENGKLIYNKDTLINKYITDEKGNIVIENIPLGKYYIKETSTYTNHVLDDKKYDINLEYINEDTPIVIQELNIKNYLKKGSLTINKYETGTSSPISNTKIELRNSDNKIIYQGYTDINGKILIKDLPYGEYYLSETEASTGYRLLEDTITLQIDSTEKIIDIYNERIKVPNTGYTLNSLDIYIIISILIGLLLIIIFRKEKITSVISIIIILLGLTYFVIKIYNYYSDYKNNQKSVSAYINNELDTIEEEKYQYNSILEIPSINLKRGILDINDIYNDAKYNIELIKEDDNVIVLASHNGNNQNSYFRDLKKLSLGDKILYYKNGILGEYIYSESYDIKKDGYADIYRQKNKKSIILITCKDNTNDGQTVHIGYLTEEKTY